MKYIKTFSLGTVNGMIDSMEGLDKRVNDFIETHGVDLIEIKDKMYPMIQNDNCPHINRVLIYEAESRVKE